MKITKEKLKTLIKEELDAMLQLETLSTSSLDSAPDDSKKGLGDFGDKTTSAVKSKTEIGQGELALEKMKAELDKIKDPAQHAKAIAHVMDKLGVTEKDLRLLLPKV